MAPIRVFIKPSARAKSMRLSASPGVGVVATVPFGASQTAIDGFLQRYAAWILKAGDWLKKNEDKTFLPRGRKDFMLHAPEAMRLVRETLSRLNAHYGFSVGRVSVRNQKTRWGSCNRKGDISFNWKLVCLPQELAEYVIAHELCHIGAFDHSRHFWSLVAETIPDWKERRRAMRRYQL